MSYDHLDDYPSDIRERAARVRLACFDVDGTLTDGRLYFDAEGREMKAFHVQDGQGLALLRRSGIAIAFVTARPGGVAARRGAELGAEVHAEVTDKLACVEAIAARHGCALEQTAFMGDDLADLKVLSRVGFSVAPGDAHAWVRERVHWRTQARAGRGAVRELCDLVLAAQGRAQAILEGAAG
jgi:3-deoxy-D-manno-octulosonate 8-phosphate phosphatase (KDO 8-P phosphatase)